MNGLHFFFGVGALISPLILARVLSLTGDIYWLFWMCTLACVPLVIWLWFLPEPPAAAHTDNDGNAPFPVFPVFLLVVLFILYVGLEMGFGNWLYTYALTLKLGTEISAAYLTSALWGAFTLGRLLGVWTAARARSQTILFMDLAGCLGSAAVILLWRESALALWVGSIGLGLCMASIFPTILMLAGERMRVTGAITGWFLVGSGAGNMLLPWLIGQVFVRTGPQTMPVIVLVDIIALLLVLIYFVTQRVGLPVVRQD
jgi:FHS family Na+ dependent glucose MFS transporter 1